MTSIDQNSRNRPMPFMQRALSLLNQWYPNHDGVIVEIGSMRQPCNHDINDYSYPCCNDGHSSLFWSLSGHIFVTCDYNPESCHITKNSIKNGTVVCDDGINFLRNFSTKNCTIDLLYLDGWDVGSDRCAENHVKAYEAAESKLSTKHIILIDDTDVDYVNGECRFIENNMAGKGRLLVPLLISKNYELVFSDRQTMLVWNKYQNKNGR